MTARLVQMVRCEACKAKADVEEPTSGVLVMPCPPHTDECLNKDGSATRVVSRIVVERERRAAP